MRPQDTKYLIREADELLNAAREELQRAEEDVATYHVCHSARQALVNYLKAYLIDNNVAIQTPITVEKLMGQCREYNARFNLINITPIDCRTHTDDSDYCLRVDKVGECLRIAELARGMVLSEVPT